MRQIRAECENGHGQDIIFGRPPEGVATVGGVTAHVPGASPDVSTIRSKGGTHPIYIDSPAADVEIYYELIRRTSAECGICGGRVSYELLD